MPSAGPFAGLTILHLTRVPSGPYCTMLLADMGALVIKVEQPGRGQQVDISMLDGVLSLLSYHTSTYLTTGATSSLVGNRHATIAPDETFPATDGDFFLAGG